MEGWKGEARIAERIGDCDRGIVPTNAVLGFTLSNDKRS